MNWLIEKIWGKNTETDPQVIVRLMEERMELKEALRMSEERRLGQLHEAYRIIERKDPEMAQIFYKKYLMF